MKPKIEICCGSAQDCLAAQAGGADRIELNSALALGGLTPTLANLIQAKKAVSLPIIAMVRSRGAGFCTTDAEFEILLTDAELLLKHGAAGLAFGALNADRTINAAQTRAMADLAHQYGREFVFHRAFDCTVDFDAAMRQLIDWKVDRVLTSGGEAKAEQGIETIARLQRNYGSRQCGQRAAFVKADWRLPAAFLMQRLADRSDDRRQSRHLRLCFGAA